MLDYIRMYFMYFMHMLMLSGYTCTLFNICFDDITCMNRCEQSLFEAYLNWWHSSIPEYIYVLLLIPWYGIVMKVCKSGFNILQFAVDMEVVYDNISYGLKISTMANHPRNILAREKMVVVMRRYIETNDM